MGTGNHSDKRYLCIRLPDGLRDRLKTTAKANRRSMNAELLTHLETGLARVEGRANALHTSNEVAGGEEAGQ